MIFLNMLALETGGRETCWLECEHGPEKQQVTKDPQIMPGFLILTLKNDMFRLLRMKLAIKLVDPEINHVLVRNLEPLLEKG